jgi:hypothetical protein
VLPYGSEQLPDEPESSGVAEAVTEPQAARDVVDEVDVVDDVIPSPLSVVVDADAPVLETEVTVGELLCPAVSCVAVVLLEVPRSMLVEPSEDTVFPVCGVDIPLSDELGAVLLDARVVDKVALTAIEDEGLDEELLLLLLLVVITSEEELDDRPLSVTDADAVEDELEVVP